MNLAAAWKGFVKAIELDRAISYTLIARAIGFVAAPISLLFILRFLSAAEQGYYYTFGSILGFSVFFHLGLPAVLSAFASHEKAFLEWGPGRMLQGPSRHLARLASIAGHGRLWFSWAAAGMAVTLYLAGAIFFSRGGAGDTDVAWLWPWLLAVVVSAGTIYVSPWLAIVEGCGQVAQIRWVSLVGGLLSYPVLWICLALGGGLFAGPLFFGTGLLVTALWLRFRYAGTFSALRKAADASERIGFSEMWPMQWRIAASWIPGFLVLSLFNPMLFKFAGPEAAGRLGVGLMLAQAVGGVGLAWVGTRAPVMGSLLALGEFGQAHRLFGRLLLLATVVTLLGGGVLLGLVHILNVISHPYAQRLPDVLSFALLLLVQPLYNLGAAVTIYVRANKEYPFVWVSGLYAVLVVVSNGTLGRSYGMKGMALGYLAATMVFAVATTLIMSRRRTCWLARAAMHPDSDKAGEGLSARGSV